MKFAPTGVDIVLDYVGPKTFPTSFDLVRKGGQVLICGIMTGREAMVSLHMTYLKHVSVKGLSLGTPEEFRTLVGWLEEGRIVPHIGEMVEFAEASKAHEKLDSGKTLGKVVLVP